MNKNRKNSVVLCTIVRPKNSVINNKNTDMLLNNEMSSEKWFKCKVCKKLFDRKSSLVLHERTHLDDRPLTCKVCQKTFLDKSLLNKHLITEGHAKSTEVVKGQYSEKHKNLTIELEPELTSGKSLQCCIGDALEIHLGLHVSNNRKSFFQNKTKISECKTSDTINVSTSSDGHQKKLSALQEKNDSEVQLNSARKEIENTCQESVETEIPLSELTCLSKEPLKFTVPDKLSVMKGTVKSFQCEICQEVFKCESLLSEHVCSRLQSHNIDVEKEKIRSSARKSFHMSSRGKMFNSIKRNSFVCCKCQEVFENKNSLSLHFCTPKNTAVIKTYNRTSKALKCNVSKKADEHKLSFNESQSLDLQQFICDICKQHFYNEEAMTFHLHCHIEDKFVCEDCQTAFDTRKLLETHRRSIGRKQFLCNVCQKTFCCEKNLVNHYDTHNGKDKFPCNLCDRLFQNKFILNVHYFSHTKNAPFFICSICLKIFSNRNNWISHYCTHMGTKPRICEICKKYFVKRRNFYLHCRIHTDEAPYICETCHKTFKYHKTLLMHRRNHVRGNL